MRVLGVLAALAVAFAGVSAMAAPLAAYGGLPSIDAIEISPDGSTLAVIVSDGKNRGIVLRPTAGGPQKTYPVGASKVRRLDWVGSDHLIVTTSQTERLIGWTGDKGEFSLGYVLDVKAQKVSPLFEESLEKMQTGTHFRGASTQITDPLNILAGPPEVRVIDGKPTVFVEKITFKEGWGVITVVRADLKSGRRDIVEFGERDTRAVLLGPEGTIIARSDYDAKSGRWALKLRQGGGWFDARTAVAKLDRPYMVGLGRDGTSVLIGELEAGGYVLREVSPDGKASEPLDVRNGDDVIFDPETRRPIGLYALVGDEGRYTFFAERDQKVWAAVKAAFKGDAVDLASWSHDRQKIVVLVDSAAEGPAYALVDLATRKAEWLGPQYEKLMPEDLSKVQPVRFKARDGLDLTGYLTLPNGREARNLPLVVLAHGGPESRDTPGFDWWSQAIASRGYAVLRVNYRGSDGFGRAFVEAGYGQWGRKMQTDLSDGARYLAAQGMIDPKRVCIVGASYGGYAALAGATIDTGVYRCAVSVAGVSDLRKLVEDEGRSAKRYWKRFMGVERLSDPALAQISPITHVDKVSIPVLMVHGRDDTVVPLEQSEIMADALRKAGKPVELIVQKGEDHWLSRGETRSAMLESTMAFVEKHNPPN
ncbi:MAG: S9 family peptidase [Phenylobacterium sp.]|uniref:alpha/beta hydrolase family protein n=1 Tax=Phenylobacterium sp. TaxID=1871053 RepID=UPI00120E72B0|nr:S9 family peptidase [Phenylobacterium sp.]TAL36031.1 MAG: S9 family peptidase [Phenylobacterium sp.]